MNKKGFTLVELIAVIIILSLLVLLASNAVSGVLKKSKNNLYNTQIDIIISASKLWGTNNLDKLPSSGQCAYLTLGDLKGLGLLEEDIINPKTNEEFFNNMKIKVVSNLTEYGNFNAYYELTEDVDECVEVYPKVCKAVTNATASRDTENELIGTIPNQRDDYDIIKYKPGDEYICEVKDNTYYHFYVLSVNNKDNEVITEETIDKKVVSVNLIMDQNINSDGTPAGVNGIMKNGDNVYNLVAWQSDCNFDSGGVCNEGGPVEAFEFLYEATSNWVNVEPINYTYKDKEVQKGSGGYTSFISKNGAATITQITEDVIPIGDASLPLRARLPMYSTDQSISEVKGNSIIQRYLYGYLDPNAETPPYGYWTISSQSNETKRGAWFIGVGQVIGHNVYSDLDGGVRPVITVKTYGFY